MAETNETCEECGAKCCRYFCFEIDKPEDFDEFDDIRWFLCHEGISVHIDDGDWYISIENRCKMLKEHNTCSIYADRPVMCRKYSPEDCDFTSGDYGYEALFEKPEDIERYARQVLGERAYETARAKAYGRRKISPKRRA